MHCLRKVPWYQLYLLGAICLSHCHTSKALVLLDHGICLPKELPDLPAPIRILGLYICGLQHHEDNMCSLWSVVFVTVFLVCMVHYLFKK